MYVYYNVLLFLPENIPNINFKYKNTMYMRKKYINILQLGICE
jgi:hypothetical protein